MTFERPPQNYYHRRVEQPEKAFRIDNTACLIGEEEHGIINTSWKGCVAYLIPFPYYIIVRQTSSKLNSVVCH